MQQAWQCTYTVISFLSFISHMIYDWLFVGRTSQYTLRNLWGCWVWSLNCLEHWLTLRYRIWVPHCTLHETGQWSDRPSLWMTLTDVFSWSVFSVWRCALTKAFFGQWTVKHSVWPERYVKSESVQLEFIKPHEHGLIFCPTMIVCITCCTWPAITGCSHGQFHLRNLS